MTTDCEAITIDALARANAEAKIATDRGEFVTPWLRRNPNISKANVRGPGGEIAEMRWTLDYPEDFEFFRLAKRKDPLDTCVSNVFHRLTCSFTQHAQVD